jgi:hypothetical protein
MLDKDSIEASATGIELKYSKFDLDFGRGFYTTTVERQARQWAWIRFYDPKYTRTTANQPVVLRFRVSRKELGRLMSLHFVLGDYGNEDFWSLAQHCRQSVQGPPPVINDHKGPNAGWYDLVTGPVAAFWQQRVAMDDADQVSFHTKNATDILNRLIQSGKRKMGNRDDYRWEPVV